MLEDDPLNVLENALRDLIELVLRNVHGDGWFNHLGVTDERVRVWEARREEEPKRRPGGAEEVRLLYYAELFDVSGIIQKNWNSGFNVCFGDRKRFDVYMDRLAAFRNPDAHSRALRSFEKHLVVGITGALRQEITVFLSAGGGGPEPEHFGRIEEVTDSYGMRATGGALSGWPSHIRSPMVLRPGDTVTFVARAWDPEGGPIKWRLFLAARTEHVELQGSEIEWEWNVDERDVSESSFVQFVIHSTRQYHRNLSGHDDEVSFFYAVLPPRS